MKTRMILLAAAATLPAALALPALANAFSTSTGGSQIAALVAPQPTNAATAQADNPLGNLVLASSEHEDDDDDHGWFGGDDDDESYENGACSTGGSYDEDDDDDCTGPQAGGPAPAGTATPPDNGLFAPGGDAVVQTN